MQNNILSTLHNADIFTDVTVYDSVTSTNDVLRDMVLDGLHSEHVLIALHQSSGKGRRGRSFYSPKDTGLYISFLLFPKSKTEDAPILTTVAAAAAAVAIENVSGINTQIKWVNDIYINGKKVSGILTEASPIITDGIPEYVIVGIGINIAPPEGGFPDEIKDIAGAVFNSVNGGLNTGAKCNAGDIVNSNCNDSTKSNDDSSASDSAINNIITKLAAELIIQFMTRYKSGIQNASSTGSDGVKDDASCGYSVDALCDAYFDDYEKRCFAIGRDVVLISPDHNARMSNSLSDSANSYSHYEAHHVLHSVSGSDPGGDFPRTTGRKYNENGDEIVRVLGINKKCHLHVLHADGTDEYLSGGEISIRL